MDKLWNMFGRGMECAWNMFAICWAYTSNNMYGRCVDCDKSGHESSDEERKSQDFENKPEFDIQPQGGVKHESDKFM